MPSLWVILALVTLSPFALIPVLAIWVIYDSWEDLGPMIDSPLPGHQEEGEYR
jgi:hypothetical protein